MNFQDKNRELRPYFVVFPFYKVIGEINKDRVVTNKARIHGSSFRNYNRALLHQINLGGRKNHYVIRISYIYVRAPNSNIMSSQK